MGNSGIRAGFIGEMGLSTPPHPDEIKALKTAARTQNQTGAGVCIHPPRDPEAPRRMVVLIKENGGQVEKNRHRPSGKDAAHSCGLSGIGSDATAARATVIYSDMSFP